MIDIHCHVLPGLDDGPADEATAVAMCRLAAENGTTDLVATPHANQRYPYSRPASEERLRQLGQVVGPAPRLHLGCDFRLHYDNIEAALADPARFTIRDGPYLLVEFSDQVISQGTASVFDRLRRAGLTPIITHPERNPLLRDHHSRMNVWIHRGCLLQITGQSLLGGFGSRARSAAIDMVNAGLVHLIASDGHDLEKRPPVLRPSYAFVVDRWGEQVAHSLFVDNPRAVLEGRALALPRPHVRRRKWWQIW